jgi:curved DNA-binding protein CbpA
MIPKNWEGTDFYRVLGVSRNARIDEIKAAHRRLVREFHPDLATSQDAKERFAEVTLAYEVLGNPKLRAQYDSYIFTDLGFESNRSALYKQRRPFLRLIGRIALFLIVIFLLRSCGYLDNTALVSNPGASLTTGNSSQNKNNNQVLALWQDRKVLRAPPELQVAMALLE